MLVKLSDAQVAAIFRVLPDGALDVDMSEVSAHIADADDVPSEPRCALMSADYLRDAEGVRVEGTFKASGLWWVSDEHDEAIVGTWMVDGRAMTVLEEGLRDAPVSDDQSLLSRATRVIAAEYPAAEAVSESLIRLPGSTPSQIRVTVARDPRIVRPQDLLDAVELSAYEDGRLGVAVVQLTGDGTALTRKYGF